MIKSTATIIVEQDKIVAEIDGGICDLYYSLIPLSFVAMKPKYGNKITVVRSPPIETFPYELGKMYNGRKINFEYDTQIQFKSPYFFLDCWSSDIFEIRRDLGLRKYRPGFNSYHITIANVKR